MASEVDYTAPQWNPPTTPPTPGNPARMQALADAVKECADRAINQTIATALNASTIVAGTQWGSGNDGNGGQPPAPKPRISAGNIGHLYALDFVGNETAHYADGTTTPRSASETYFIFAITFTDASKTLYRLETVNIVAGNVNICSLTSTYRFIGFSWRIS